MPGGNTPAGSLRRGADSHTVGERLSLAHICISRAAGRGPSLVDFCPKVLPMYLEYSVSQVSGMDPSRALRWATRIATTTNNRDAISAPAAAISTRDTVILLLSANYIEARHSDSRYLYRQGRMKNTSMRSTTAIIGQAMTIITHRMTRVKSLPGQKCSFSACQFW